MEQSTRNKRGTLRVSENVIITIVKNSACEVDGVASIALKPFNLKSLINPNLDNTCVSVAMLDGVAKITLSVVAKSGYNMVNVCEQIQERVKAAVQSMTGVTVSKVNVSVVGVVFPESDAE